MFELLLLEQDLLKLLKENNMSDQFLQYIEQNEDKLIQSKASIQNVSFQQ